MLLNLHKKKWTDGFVLRPFDAHSKTSSYTDELHVYEMLNLATKYNKAVQEEDELPQMLCRKILVSDWREAGSNRRAEAGRTGLSLYLAMYRFPLSFFLALMLSVDLSAPPLLSHKEMLNLATKYNKAVQEEDELPQKLCADSR